MNITSLIQSFDVPHEPMRYTLRWKIGTGRNGPGRDYKGTKIYRTNIVATSRYNAIQQMKNVSQLIEVVDMKRGSEAWQKMK